jgi:HK97 gp10 family phage protein
MKTEFRLHGVDGVLDMLRALPPEIVSKRGGPVRAALRKGARVIHRAAKANIEAKTGEDPALSTGLLAESLVVSRGKAPAGGGGERYLVRLKRKTYPGRKGKPTTTLKSGHLLEYGSSQQPAEPWLRPAFAIKAREAIETIERDLLRSIDRITKRLARSAAGGR